ncbi:MAG: hypothetical protein N4A74_25375 [Carboxylicivirga sp.]|jgi:hypothetical protein|nr:hypothetical protein [Carboxylicivirga sp.]
MNIKELSIEILELLEKNNEKSWSLVFKKIVDDCDSSDIKTLKRSILKYYGGMGSFNDLIIYKDGKVFIDENNRLDDLRSKLFSIASKI